MSVVSDLQSLSPTVDALVRARNELRKARAYEAADRLRAELAQLTVGIYHVSLDDETEDGTWHWTTK